MRQVVKDDRQYQGIGHRGPSDVHEPDDGDYERLSPSLQSRYEPRSDRGNTWGVRVTSIAVRTLVMNFSTRPLSSKKRRHRPDRFAL